MEHDRGTFHVEHPAVIPSGRYFVTGTDTGVGKTFVTVALAGAARAAGAKVFAFKPIETGTDAELGDDQRLLVEAAGGWQTGDLRGLYQYSLPAAPLVAAAAANRPIALDRIDHVFAEGTGLSTFVLVEGAGGLRVPITESLDMAGLAARLDLPLIIVARAGLGTINHSLLTIEAAERSGLAVAAVVLSRRPEDDAAVAESNAAEIRRRWPGQVLIFAGAIDSLGPLVKAA